RGHRQRIPRGASRFPRGEGGGDPGTPGSESPRHVRIPEVAAACARHRRLLRRGIGAKQVGRMDPNSPLGRTVAAITGDANTTGIMGQVAVAAGAIALAFLLARAICARVTPRRWRFGKGSFEPVLFPLLSVLFVWSARIVLAKFQDGDGGATVILAVL